MGETADYLSTIRLAESVLAQLRRHKLPATPRNFEFWYVYEAGFNRSLTEAVDDIVAVQGRVTPDDLLDLQARYLSAEHLGDRILEIGGTAGREIDELSADLDAILAETAEYGALLMGAADDLRAATSTDGTSETVDHLLKATHRIERRKCALEARLAESRTRLSALRINIESIRFEPIIDPLTTLWARQHFDQAIQRAVDEADQYGIAVSLILTDVDHFKSFNDRYGHQTGDQVLRLVAQSAKQNIKGRDIACRYGGEEFAIILREASEVEATSVGEQIRLAVMSRELAKPLTGEKLSPVTISAGVAAYRPGDTPQTLIERADLCLYRAKRAGRNRVVSEKTDQTVARDVA